MKLILRNKILRTSKAETFSDNKTTRTIIGFTLAAIVSGVNYYIQNFITDK